MRVHKGLQFMGSWETGGSQAGSGVQCGVPSGGRGGQAWEGFPRREDGHRGQTVRGGRQDWDLFQLIPLGRFLSIPRTWFPVCAMSKKLCLFKTVATLQMGPFFPWLQAPGDLGSSSQDAGSYRGGGDRQLCLCMPLLRGMLGAPQSHPPLSWKHHPHSLHPRIPTLMGLQGLPGKKSWALSLLSHLCSPSGNLSSAVRLAPPPTCGAHGAGQHTCRPGGRGGPGRHPR